MACLVGSGEPPRIFNGGQEVINLNRVFIVLCFVMLSFVLDTAGGATNEAVNASPQDAVDGKTSDAGALPRDPFWPIGYVPPSFRGGTSSAKLSGSEPGGGALNHVADISEMLKIRGVIRKGGRFYATINGFTVQAGEVVTAIVDGKVYKFVVERLI